MNGNINEKRTTYGFIQGEDNNRYFFHKSELTNCTIFSLDEGDSVEFEETIDEYGRLKAVNISKLVVLHQLKVLLILESIRASVLKNIMKR